MTSKGPFCSQCQYNSVGSGFAYDDWGEKAIIAILLEALGSDEAIEGRPLVGRASRFHFQNLIEPLGYHREDLLICNVVRCHPPANKYPAGPLRHAAEQACRQYDKWHQWERKPAPGGIAKFDPNVVVLTYHPSGVLRTPAFLRQTRRDLERAFTFAKQGYRPLVAMGGKACALVAPWFEGRGGLKTWRGHYFFMQGWPYA